MAKADTTQIVDSLNSLAQQLVNTFISVNVARLKADVFSAAYAAHIRAGALPEEARSLARSTAEYMYSLVEPK